MSSSRLISILAAAALGLPAASIPDAAEILKRSDLARNGSSSYVVRVKISNHESGKQDEEHLYEAAQKGTDKTRVEFLSPREKGRYLLMLGDDMWIYLPDTGRPVRITPLERLTGNASNGDVARTNYAVDYNAAYLRTEKAAGVECHVLRLDARRKGSTYHRIEYWVNTANSRPVKADFYLTSGKHIKSATFDEYREVDGISRLRKMTIYDEIRKNSYSVMEYLSYSEQALPDKLFHQGRSDRF